MDWACCYDDRSSIGCSVVFLGFHLVSWSSRKQPTFSRSSRKRVKALVNATVEIIWVQTLLYDLGVSQPQATILWCDNIGDTYLSANPVSNARTKHIEVDYHFLRGKVAQKLLDIITVSTDDHVI